MSEDKKGSHHHTEEPSHYGTFQGVANYPPPTAVGFPQPVPPPGASGSQSQSYAHGYQTVQGYPAPEGSPRRERRLHCCGCGVGWFIILSFRFIIGFFLVGIPWYITAILLMCSRNIDPREKPGYVACTVAAVLAAFATIFGLTKVT